MSEKKHNLAKCPECGSVIQVDEFDEIGDVLFCHDCNSELEIIKINPPKFRCISSGGYENNDDDYEYLNDIDDLREDLSGEWN